MSNFATQLNQYHMSKKLVIFDLDGTLLDTIEDLANATNHALQQHGFTVHPVETYRFFVGNGANKLIERALPEDKRNPEMVALLKKDFVSYYFANAEACTKPYPGISDLVKKLHAEGYQLAVASNKIHEATVSLVKRFFPEITFSIILGQRDGVPVKPNPQILDEIVDFCGVNKSETIYMGDSGVDASTALAASIDFIGVLWGFRPQAELEQAGATNFIAKPDEALKFIEK